MRKLILIGALFVASMGVAAQEGTVTSTGTLAIEVTAPAASTSEPACKFIAVYAKGVSVSSGELGDYKQHYLNSCQIITIVERRVYLTQILHSSSYNSLYIQDDIELDILLTALGVL